MLKLCSIDFDYFFPAYNLMDWGHNDKFPEYFMNQLWQIRAVNKYRISGEFHNPIDFFVPNSYEINKLKSLISFNKHPTLIIAESHKSIFEYIELHNLGDPNIEIYNFDAHHDLYTTGRLDCSNWAYHLMLNNWLSKYHVIYPDWRKKYKDGDINLDGLKDNYNPIFHYEVPKLPKFDALFICRSGSWTPPWNDNIWLDFINHWRGLAIFKYGNFITDSISLRKRPFNIKKAAQYREKLF